MIPLITRRVAPRDILGVRSLCLASFPIQYPDSWYDDVVSGSLTSLGIFSGDRIVALIVAEYKYLIYCNSEDRDIVSEEGSPVVYILSLAVSNDHRRQGLATTLMRQLLDVYTKENGYCDRQLPRAVFLHVLATNSAAIAFYRSHGFVLHETLLNYYRLKDGVGDGQTYVLYVNGGHRPYSYRDVCRFFTRFFCSPISTILKTGTTTHYTH